MTKIFRRRVFSAFCKKPSARGKKRCFFFLARKKVFLREEKRFSSRGRIFIGWRHALIEVDTRRSKQGILTPFWPHLSIVCHTTCVCHKTCLFFGKHFFDSVCETKKP